MEDLEQHKEMKSEESFRAYSAYIQEVFVVLKEAGSSDGNEKSKVSEEACADRAASEEEIKRAVGWLQALQHNQHAITCDLTGDMLGCMISPEGSLFNHECNPNLLWVMGARGQIRFVVTEDTEEGKVSCSHEICLHSLQSCFQMFPETDEQLHLGVWCDGVSSPCASHTCTSTYRAKFEMWH